MLAPLFTVKRRLTSNKIQDAIHAIEVVADDENTLPYVEGRIEALLQERHGIVEGDENDFEVTNLKEIVDKIDNIGFILSILLTAIASISLLVGSIGIMNMMLVSVTERTREIGIRKTVGAKDKDIMTQFLLESVLISSVGSFIGMILGIILSQIAGIIFDKNVPISISTIMASAMIAIAVGIVSGIVPALRATKLDPTEALRYQ
jgi:putative ABC transport system permease protein